MALKSLRPIMLALMAVVLFFITDAHNLFFLEQHYAALSEASGIQKQVLHHDPVNFQEIINAKNVNSVKHFIGCNRIFNGGDIVLRSDHDVE